jgi:fido (protein-threonine AMPylation protein)/DNA-binding transcriptional ArsR family regulator
MDNFEEYLRQGEPDKVEKAKGWNIAIGLQQVDGLKPSEYLIENAKQNIEGDISIEEVKVRIDDYYKHQAPRNTDDRTEEADKVSARISEILGEQTFTFSPMEYLSIHRRLFQGTYAEAGKIRDYNITKKEWVLDGETVLYGSAISLKTTLEYDFEKEKKFSYKGLDKREISEHIALFISDLWQIHVFGEGNTRATAIFLIKYLRTFGFEVNNTLFAKHSWYFRNALVRANYRNYEKNIHFNPHFLFRFFENLLLGETHVLRNREMHILFSVSVSEPRNGFYDLVKSDFDPVNDPVKNAILEILKVNPSARYDELADTIKVSKATIKRHIQGLKKLGIIERIGSDKTGRWRVNPI